MEKEAPPQGTEPISEVQTAERPSRPPNLHPGIVLRVRGRTVRLRALRKPPTGILYWLSILGPGLIAGAVSNDAGSIATYSQAGAQFGYDLLWVVVLITVSLIVVQEMSARLGAATGRGLLGLIRKQFGIGWALFATLIVIVANFGLTLGEFLGISSALELFGISRWISVPATAILIGYLVLGGSYNRVEKIFMLMAAVFLAYPIAAFIAHPKIMDVLHGAFVPVIHTDPAYITLVIGLVGTTLSPYQQVFQQSAVVEKGIPRRHYNPERWDTIIGMIFSNLVTIFIIVATAATLHFAGKTHINTAAEAAKALEPVAGSAAEALFGIGIVGASLMAAVVVTISTSFAFTSAFGLQGGISLELRRAPAFYGLFIAQVVLAALLSLIHGLPAFQLLVWVQVLNGILFPFLLAFILILVNNRKLMGDLNNTRLTNILGWGTLILISAAVLFGLLQQALPLFGIHLFGS